MIKPNKSVICAFFCLKRTKKTSAKPLMFWQSLSIKNILQEHLWLRLFAGSIKIKKQSHSYLCMVIIKL